MSHFDLKGKANKLRGKEPVEQDELRDAEDSLTDQSKDLSTEPDADDAIMITDEDLRSRSGDDAE